MTTEYRYTPADFKSDQEVKWCPGCGSYAILNSVTRVMPEVAEAMGYKMEDFTVISGIGCSSRFPYYVGTYGFHSIHGRALPIATGTKVANPKLSVWVTTGDGDSLAIGGNHFIHAIRRNVDINVVLFNNEIYGLTKGQYSPTSKMGKVTATSPFGTVEEPFVPGRLTLGAGGRFFARSIDMELELTKECLVEGAAHSGLAMTEVLQNCLIFNDKFYAAFAGTRELRSENTITLKHGEKMIFGKERNKGLVLDGDRLRVVEIGEGESEQSKILVHNAKSENTAIHMMLIEMKYPEFPVAVGVIRNVQSQSYDSLVTKQIEDVKKTASIKSVDDLLKSGSTWEV